MKNSATLPRYAQFAERMREDIRGGKLKPGERLPSFGDFNSEHGLSQNTWDKMCGLLVNEGLVVRRPRSGVFVAERLQRQALGTLGLLIDSGSESEKRHPYYMELFEGARAAARHHNRELLFLHDDSEINFQKCDGLLTLGADVAALQPRLPAGMALVAMLHANADVPTVSSGDAAGIVQAVAHLLQLGHRRIGFLTSNDPVSQRRVQSYQQILRAAGIEPSPDWVRLIASRQEVEGEPYFSLAGHIAMERWLAQDWNDLGCTALLCQNDDTAIGVIEALRDANYEVPGDISVVGFDGAIEVFRPRLTTVEVPLREIGARAVELLLEIADGYSSHAEGGHGARAQQTLILPTRLKIGETTAPVKVL